MAKDVGSMEIMRKVANTISRRTGIRIEFGQSPCTDGKTVWLPAVDSFTNDKENTTVYLMRGLLDHELGHIIGKSTVDMKRKMSEEYGQEAANAFNWYIQFR